MVRAPSQRRATRRLSRGGAVLSDSEQMKRLSCAVWPVHALAFLAELAMAGKNKSVLVAHSAADSVV